MILNLTQHPATPEQTAAGVIEPPAEIAAQVRAALTVDALPSRTEILDRCAQIALLAVHNGLGEDDDPHPQQAMIGGAPWMMRALEDALLAQGIQPIYAFSLREGAEQTAPDGAVRKVNVFRHVGFVEAF
jgi:hypothetical protein